MQFDQSAYMSLFLDELGEQLQILDEGLLQLESEANVQIIAAIFRAAHTLKGSSAAMGFTKLELLTHRLENVFDLIRNNQLQLDAAVMNTVFDTVDQLKLLRQGITDGTMDSMNISQAVQALDQLCNKKEEAASASSKGQSFSGFRLKPEQHFPPNDKNLELLAQVMLEGYTVYRLLFRLSDEQALQAVRAHLICSRLKEMGQLLAGSPELDTLLELEPFPEEWAILLGTKATKEEIQEEIERISQIEAYEIHQWEQLDLESPHLSTGPSTRELTAASPAAEDPKTASSGREEKQKWSQTIRVDVDRIEHLLNLVGELIIDNTRLLEVKTRLSQQLFGVIEDKTNLNGLHDISNHLTRVVSELQESMMKTRMLPVEQLFSRFPRMVRDITQKAGKEIDFVMIGKETELDRTLIEEISDPLIHILRNAADHGIETPEERMAAGKSRKGTLTLKAEHRENLFIIKVSDNGRGIDPLKVKAAAIKKGIITEEEASRMSDKEAVSIIFRSGFSTAKQVTDLSGRGVGMDIVSSRIEKLNGMIDVDTKVGEGTVMTIKLPLTLAIIKSLLVKIGQGVFALPLVNVIEIVRLSQEDIRSIRGEQVCVIRGEIIPLIQMKEKLGMAADRENQDRMVVVVVGLAEKKVCLRVDHTVGNQEIVIKSIGGFVGDTPHIAGSTILGGGNVALVLDVGSIIREEGTSRSSSTSELIRQGNRRVVKQLVVFQSGNDYYAIDIDGVKEIVTLPHELTSVQGAPSYVMGVCLLRGALLPIIHLQEYMGYSSRSYHRTSRVIVIEGEQEDLGILVDRVVEVVGVEDEEVDEVPEFSNTDSSLVRGIYKKNGKMIQVLDTSKISGGTVVC